MRVLLIDNDELTLEVFKNALVLNGFDCDTTGNPDKAMLMYKESPYDLIICDYYMPYSNGLDLSIEIMAEYPDARIILYSAEVGQEVFARAISCGIMDFMDKPIDWQRILLAITNLKNNIDIN